MDMNKIDYQSPSKSWVAINKQTKDNFKKSPITLAILAGALSILSASYSYSTYAASNFTINNDEHRVIDDIWDNLLANDPKEDGAITIGKVTNGTVTVTGHGQMLTRLLSIGTNGSYGTLNVEQGGKVFVTNSSYYAYPLAIGGNGGPGRQSVGGSGTVNIRGAGSEMVIDRPNDTGEISIGTNGATGYLNITDGGKFTALQTPSGKGVLIGSRGVVNWGISGVHSDGYSKGYVTVDGKDSLFYSGDRVLIGIYSEGQLLVTNGATAKTDDYFGIGGSRGIETESILSVSGDHSLAQAKNIFIGSYQTDRQGSDGVAIATDGGTLLASDSITIALVKNTNGKLIIGSRAGESASRAGTVDTDRVQFGQGTGEIVFNHTDEDYLFNPALLGNGTVSLLHGNTALTADNSGFTGTFSTQAGATLTAQRQENLSNASISNNGALTLASNGDWQFINPLTGNGGLNVDTNHHQFSFASDNDAGFTGTVALNNTAFMLADRNTLYLGQSSLQLNTGSVTTVGEGAQTIGGLTFNGGKLIFGSITPGETVSQNRVETAASGQLDIRGTGQVQVTKPLDVINHVPAIDGNKTLLEQDDEHILVTLVKANGDVIGTGGQIVLMDEQGNIVSDAQRFDVSQDGITVANSTYDYQLTSGANHDGLYISYGLKQLELLGQDANALILSPRAGATGLAADLRAQLTGSGDLAIDAPGQTVSLSNGGNDYTGHTVVRQGTLSMANNNVLGQTASLQLAENTQLEMNGYRQSVGRVETATDSTVNISQGSLLTVTGDLQVAGAREKSRLENDTLVGSGGLILVNSDLAVNGENQRFSGDVWLNTGSVITLNQAFGLGSEGKVTLSEANDRLDITLAPTRSTHSHLFSKALAGNGAVSLLNATDMTLIGDNTGFNGIFNVAQEATLRASDQQHLGSADINLQGVLDLTADAHWALDNTVDGSGSLNKQGLGALVVNHDLTYRGKTTVEEGTLVIGDSLGSAGSLSGSHQINVLTGAVLSGTGVVSGNVDNQGTLSALNGLSGYDSSGASNFTVGELINRGQINLAGSVPGNRLTVTGNYNGSGNNSLILNTVLGDDHSVTDKLVIEGDSTGSTDLIVNNVNGEGSLTQNGIQVINVGGHSGAEFKLVNRAVAGAYEYLLHKNGRDSEDGHWYLRSEKEEDNNVNPNPPPIKPEDNTPVYRPEAGSYIANMAAANAMFNLRLEDREGRAENSSLWLRQSGHHTRLRESSTQLRTSTNSYIIQGGGEILSRQFTDRDRLGLGVILGYGYANSKTHSDITGYHAKGRVDGYSTGLYATWYQDAASLNGLYIDSWLQYSWLNASVNGEKLAQESYKINGYSASLESGYRLPVYQGIDSSVFITPQAQLTYNGLSADDYTESGGTQVQASGSDNILTRLGMRVSRDGVADKDKGTLKLFTVYGEMNWLYNSKLVGAKMNGVQLEQSGNRNLGELKLGAEGKINRHINLWTNVAQQWGDDKYTDTSVNIGFKYQF